MKKINEIAFYMFIFYIILIILLIIFGFFTSFSSIELEISDSNKEKLNDYSIMVDKMEDGVCKENLGELVDYLKKTSYEGKTSINKFSSYFLQENVLDYYSKIKESCNLTDDVLEKHNIATRYVTISLSQDTIVNKFMFQYELKFKDIFSSLAYESDSISLMYKILIDNELELLKSYIDITKENNNETK